MFKGIKDKLKNSYNAAAKTGKAVLDDAKLQATDTLNTLGVLVNENTPDGEAKKDLTLKERMNVAYGHVSKTEWLKVAKDTAQDLPRVGYGRNRMELKGRRLGNFSLSARRMFVGLALIPCVLFVLNHYLEWDLVGSRDKQAIAVSFAVLVLVMRYLGPTVEDIRRYREGSNAFRDPGA